MNFTKVHNPSDTEVALQFLGQTYTIGAGKTSEFPEDVARHWLTIYGFMTIDGSVAEPKEEKAEKVETIIKTKVVKKK